MPVLRREDRVPPMWDAGLTCGRSQNPGPGSRQIDRPVGDVVRKATVVDSVSDEFLMPSAMGAPGDASVEHAMQPVGPKRRLRRIFDDTPHAK